MLSDGRIISRPLQKLTCQTCGYGFHSVPPTRKDLRDFFDEDYSLGQRDPSAEMARAQLYADVIEPFLANNMKQIPSHLVEVGCGMGSLLSLLARRWKCETVLGVEPSKQLADFARENNAYETVIWQGFAEDIASTYENRFDLCLSINVIEHTLSPTDFMDVCRKTTHQDGYILIICPDGQTPNLELLFYDHISSFTLSALEAFALRVGLKIIASEILEGPLLGFQMVLLQRSTERTTTLPAPSRLAEARTDLLNIWRHSEARLARALGGKAYAIFGAGEFADLLAAYCPQIIDNAQSIVVDTPFQERYLGKPLISTDTFLEQNDGVLVAAVNERSWQTIQELFTALGVKIYHPQLSFMQEYSHDED